MKTFETVNENIQWKIANNFRFSGLSIDQYLGACMQFLHAKKQIDGFQNLTVLNQVSYLLQNNVLGYRFLGDKDLIDILNNLENIKLIEIFSIISNVSPKSTCGSNINLNLSTLLNDKDNILIVGIETMLNQLSSLCSMDKNITLWTINIKIKEVLDFDFKNYSNINIELIDIYTNNNKKQSKFSNIICIPPFGLKRQIQKGQYYGNDSSTIATELLFENNLADDGVLITVMPSKVNFSQMEAHFRQAYENYLAEVVDLPTGTFSNTNIKSYLYKFSKKQSDELLISGSIDTLGEKYKLSDVRNIDTTWDFEKPFKDIDEDIAFILNQKHKKLEEVSFILRGKPLSKLAQETNEEEDFVYIDMRAIKESDIDYSEAKKYIIDKDLSAEYLQNGDLLIPNKGSTTKVVMYKDSDKKCIASANLIVIRSKNDVINANYLLTYLRSSVGQKLIKNLQRGAAIPFINHEDLKGLAIIVPKIEKQNEFIETYQSKMENYKKELEQIKSNIVQLEQEINDAICGKL